MRSFRGCAVALALAMLSACDFGPKSRNGTPVPSQGNARAVSETGPSTENGNLAIQVPVGAVGGDYWIYVDGHIASGPPHGIAARQNPDIVLAARRSQEPTGEIVGSNGWSIATIDGPVLGITHENWDSSLADYLNASPKDRLHIFQETDVAVTPGSHTVEIAFLTQANHEAWNSLWPSFPFAISRKYTTDVQANHTAQIFAAIPDLWSPTAELSAAAALCPAAQPPDAKHLRDLFAAYAQDPIVVILRKSSFAMREPSERTAMLDLPPEQGGPREFDAGQIGDIVDAIVANHPLPTQDEISNCAKRYPILARSFASYGQTVALFASDMDSFRKFRDTLAQAR
jgi:hypothetical protein